MKSRGVEGEGLRGQKDRKERKIVSEERGKEKNGAITPRCLVQLEISR